MQTIFQNSTGLTLSIVLTSGGVPVDISGVGTVVTLNLYSFSLNTLKWSHAATVDNGAGGLAHVTSIATDFDTLGDFYSNIVVTKTAYSQTYMGDTYKVIVFQQSKVTPPELLQFMNIPPENAMPNETIQVYIDQAQSLLLLSVPALKTTVDQSYLNIMQRLIMIRSATLYFMNMGESNINPDIRMQKIKLWTEEYNNACDKLNSVLSNTSDDSGVVRRSKNSSTMPSPLSQSYDPYAPGSDYNNLP